MKNINKKFRKLPQFKVLTINYTDGGRVLNEKEIIDTRKNYYIEDIINVGRFDDKTCWVEYMCEKRDEPQK